MENSEKLGRPETEESVDQFIFRIKTYLEKWVELADVEATFEGVKNLMIKELVSRAINWTHQQ